ncbi:MAG TPA: surface-adhesin E family protein [Allosphingosinicella sp.]|nr:surface-adhesin E family protein [Allosphingosinicella sp.]
MIELVLAAALAQAADPCHVGQPDAGPPHCPRWRQVQLVRAITDASGYVDPASARRDGNVVEINTLTVPTAPIGGNVARFVARVRLDCVARTTRVLHFTGYDAAGGIVHDAPAGLAAAEPAPAGSPRAALIDEFCAR